MVRDTSIEAYQKIEAEGLLSKLRWIVYDYIYHHGPCTQRQVERGLLGRLSHSITPRFAELEDLGVIKSVGEVKSDETNHMNISWDVTSNLPNKDGLKKIPKSILNERQACAKIATEWGQPLIAQAINNRSVDRQWR